MWGNKASASQGLFLSGVFRDMLAPLFLMVATNVFLAVLLESMTTYDWSIAAAGSALAANPVAFIQHGFKLPSRTALTILGSFAAFQLALMRLVPGKVYRGPVTSAGNVPVYNANGFQCFVITLVTYLLGAYWFRAFNPSQVYDYYGEMLTGLTLFSLGLCVCLYFKGLLAPSSTDSGTNGNFLMDIYWGTELYPRVLGWDVKMFTNCRFGMMVWAIAPLAFAHKSMELHGGVLSYALMTNCSLQLIYCAKVRRGAPPCVGQIYSPCVVGQSGGRSIHRVWGRSPPVV